MYLGIDIGSVAAKVVVLDNDLKIVESHYVRTHGQPFETILSILKNLSHNLEEIKCIATTGTGGKTLASIVDAVFTNEIVAQATGTGRFHPDIKTIIEIGGEDAKIIRIHTSSKGNVRIIDFATNTACAAGTGSFLDQQASRLGIAIENIGKESLKSTHPATVAARCSVFAKTDMIHLQQVGTSISDIIAGLCFAMARNFKSNIAKGIALEKPIAFQGGVAANQGMVKAFKETLEISEKDIIVPQHFALMGAIGAVLAVVSSPAVKPKKNITDRQTLNDSEKKDFKHTINKLEKYLAERKLDLKILSPLQSDGYQIQTEPLRLADGNDKIEAYLGVDVGSISTNVVVIDKDNNVLARRYLMTAGRPIEAVRQGLLEVGHDIADKVIIKGSGSTGSGRYLTGEFFGADVIRNEITSHARASAAVDPKVDTIFEIGGQDSKYISLKDGVVIDFTMNKVCAAGTGSFLEEQAEKLAVKIDQEFAQGAFGSKTPCSLGERCTVFMESQLNYYKQLGVLKNDLLAGLSFSIVDNYLNKVVEKRRIGERIFFQGGVAFNRAVKSAFEQVVGKKIIVPPHHDILGAIGVAILAKEEKQLSKYNSRFKGFDLRHINYESSAFECTDCPNNCEIHKIKFTKVQKTNIEPLPPKTDARLTENATGQTPQADKEKTASESSGTTELFYGSRCGKYDNTQEEESRLGESTKLKTPNLFKERQKMLLASIETTKGRTSARLIGQVARVGIPRVSVFYDLYPLWNAFFSELGCEVVLSDATNRSIIKKGVEHVVAEPCFPIKTAHGHIINLLTKNIDYLFLPFQVNMPPLTGHFERSYNCPYIQALPDTTKSAIDYAKYKVKIIRPVFHMDRGKKEIEKTLRQIAKSLSIPGITNKQLERSIEIAFETQQRFDDWQTNHGKEILDQHVLSKDSQPAVVLVSRSYNSYDTGLNLNLVEKLKKLGLLVIPMDFLPLNLIGEETGKDYPYMYWRSGQKILAAANYIAKQKNLFAIYLTNFNCGPDSYITKFFEKEMHGKPYLSLEIDEHSADVGMLTRCEAFIDTIKNARTTAYTNKEMTSTVSFSSLSRDEKTLYIPYMDDHSYIVSAALRATGIESEPLEPSDEQSLIIGRKHTSGRECFPSIITTGDILKKSYSPDFKAERSAFFMPSAKGPCRFGQYNKLHRMVLDEIGLTDVALITFDQTSGFHKDMAVLGSNKFKINVWHGLVLMDLIQKLSRETRPYEIAKGETDDVFKKTFKELESFIADGHSAGGGSASGTGAPRRAFFRKNIDDLTKDIVKQFDAIKTDRTIPKPKIGIIGEIYVRSNPFTNNHIINSLEKLGAEVSLPPFEEWLDYIDYLREEDYLLKKDYLSYLKQKITLIFQEREANRIRKFFKGKIRNFYKESPTSETIKYGTTYIEPALRGEVILSMGRAVEYVHHGFNGIVNIIPFGCMPGTIVTALLKRFKNDHPVPVFTLTVDGTKNPGEEMRIEAFVRQCQENMSSGAK
ncbi:MAG: acyl-CoA dehydratase activase [Planctomycetota bacterium]